MKKKSVKHPRGVITKHVAPIDQSLLDNLTHEQLESLIHNVSDLLAEKNKAVQADSTKEFQPKFKAITTKLNAALKKKIVFQLIVPLKCTATVSADLDEFYREEMAENFRLDMDVEILGAGNKLTKGQKESIREAFRSWIEEQIDYTEDGLWELIPEAERKKFEELNTEVVKFSDTLAKKGLDLDVFNVK